MAKRTLQRKRRYREVAGSGAWLYAAIVLLLLTPPASSADGCSAQDPCIVSGPAIELGGARDVPTTGLAASLRDAIALSDPARHLPREAFLIGAANADHDDSYSYRLPYGDDVSYEVLQGYGSKLSHRGSEYFTVDFRMPEGTLVHAARDGVVVLVEQSFDRACWAEGCGRYANFVVILHTDGTTGEYFHLAHDSLLVAVGDRVKRGQALARSGNTGYSTAPHLHFGVYRREALGNTRSVAVRFMTREGVINEPRPGARYENARN